MLDIEGLDNKMALLVLADGDLPFGERCDGSQSSLRAIALD
jgi:hypothetical protein